MKLESQHRLKQYPLDYFYRKLLTPDIVCLRLGVEGLFFRKHRLHICCCSQTIYHIFIEKLTKTWLKTTVYLPLLLRFFSSATFLKALCFIRCSLNSCTLLLYKMRISEWYLSIIHQMSLHLQQTP